MRFEGECVFGFIQTSMGKKFIQGDVPRLINALERIEDKLEEKEKKKVRQKADCMQLELFEGGILDVFVLEALGYPELYVSLDVGGESKQGVSIKFDNLERKITTRVTRDDDEELWKYEIDV